MNIDTSHFFSGDTDFDRLLPENLQAISRNQWTPIMVARKAAEFLAEIPGSRILDIGSGAGKFCLTAAYFNPASDFHGIEQRSDQHRAALSVKERLLLQNVHFRYGNVTEVSFEGFQGFYFYNSFHENLIYGSVNEPDSEECFELNEADGPDESAESASDRYVTYSDHIRRALEGCIPGTKLVTYYGQGLEVPYNYRLVSQDFNSHLKFWIRK